MEYIFATQTLYHLTNPESYKDSRHIYFLKSVFIDSSVRLSGNQLGKIIQYEFSISDKTARSFILYYRHRCWVDFNIINYRLHSYSINPDIIFAHVGDIQSKSYTKDYFPTILSPVKPMSKETSEKLSAASSQLLNQFEKVRESYSEMTKELAEIFGQQLTNFNNQNTTNNMKKGQIITAESPRGKSIYILGEDGEVTPPARMKIIIGKSHIDGMVFGERLYVHQDVSVRLATPEEGRELFKFIEENGWKYDSKTMMAYGKSEEFVANDGDFCLSEGGCPMILKYTSSRDFISSYAGVDISGDVVINSKRFTTSITRLLTPSEKSDFLSKLLTVGYEWNATEKRVEKKLWRAEKDEDYFTVTSIEDVTDFIEDNDSLDDRLYSSGNYFQTESEAKEYLEKVKNVFLERKLIR